MVVIATPVTSPANDTMCSDQQLLSPRITALYGVELPTKKRAITSVQGQVAAVECQFFNRDGNPVNLTSCGIVDGELELVVGKLRESINACNKVYDVDATVITADEGVIQFTLPTFVANNPGVYHLEVAVALEDDNIAFSNQFYLWVNRGLFGNPKYPNAGPPSIDEIRLFIRDNSPDENRLIDDFEFDLAEICYATELGVRYWNEAQPPIGVYFDTTNYVVRHKWLMFIAGHLLVTAAHRFRRNHLPYQAGGLSIDDQNKFQMYDQSGMLLMQEYKEWVKNKKVQINCQMAITSSGSPYGANAYMLLNTGL